MSFITFGRAATDHPLKSYENELLTLSLGKGCLGPGSSSDSNQ